MRRACHHVCGYDDGFHEAAIDETTAAGRSSRQYNEEHGITPQTIKKAVRDLISISRRWQRRSVKLEKDPESMSKKELEKLIEEVEKKMQKAAAELNFEAAAVLRDQMIELKNISRMH